MRKFDKLTGIAAPLPLINIDTDMIIPKKGGKIPQIPLRRQFAIDLAP